MILFLLLVVVVVVGNMNCADWGKGISASGSVYCSSQ